MKKGSNGGVEYWSTGVLEYWSTGVLPLLYGLLLFNGLDFVLIAHLASVSKSGGDPELRQNVGLKRHPQHYNKNKP